MFGMPASVEPLNEGTKMVDQKRRKATADLRATTAARRVGERGVKVSQEVEKATGKREPVTRRGVTASQARKTKRMENGVPTYGAPIKK